LENKTKNCVGVFIGDFINNNAITLNISFKGHGNSYTCHLAQVSPTEHDMYHRDEHFAKGNLFIMLTTHI